MSATCNSLDRDIEIEFNNLIVYASRYNKPEYRSVKANLITDIWGCIFRLEEMATKE